MSLEFFIQLFVIFLVTSSIFLAKTRRMQKREENHWRNKLWVERLLWTSALLSFCSVSLNTPKTFRLFPFLRPATLTCDFIVALVYTAEMVANIRGLLKGTYSFLNYRWCLFDASMLSFLWISALLQAILPYAPYHSLLRAPRPLILIRCVRVFFKIYIPDGSQIHRILKRSTKQVYNVTLFFGFFVLLYAILGVHLFGNVDTNMDFNISDVIHCSISDYQCPRIPQRVHNGFDNILISIFTVYQAFSQENWVSMIDRATNTLPAWCSIIYFPTMIFFLSWLMKNIFLAVIIEIFNEIRVQFHRKSIEKSEVKAPIITSDDDGWKFAPVNEAALDRTRGTLLSVLNSIAFHVLIMVAVLANSIITVTMNFEHDHQPRNDYCIEVAFTVFFLSEVLFKIYCLGFAVYYDHAICKFELLLAIGTTIHVIPTFYSSALTFFQVLRIVRLALLPAQLLNGPENFIYKILGPVKKLGSLIILTMAMLMVTSNISMQLFCFLTDFTKFETFSDSMMTMFQILMQEAWVEVMNETTFRTSEIVAIYFIFCHLFFRLIVSGLFVAVILDNLDMKEDMKKEKQVKAREQNAQVKNTLPRRLRIFENFHDRPKMARLKYVEPGFKVPKVRDSFMQQFMFGTPGNEKFQPKMSDVPVYRKKKSLQLLRNVDAPCNRAPTTTDINESNSRLLLRSFQSICRQKTRIKQSSFTGTDDTDIQLLENKRQQAELRRKQQEDVLRENHPYFDTPLFFLPRDSRLRRLCQNIVSARYLPTGRNLLCQRIRNLFGLVTYLDWLAIVVTTLSCLSITFETPHHPPAHYQVAELSFVVFMGIELGLKILAEGLVFTPKALLKDASGIFDVFTFVVGLVVFCWPSNAQCLLLLRCLRPLRIFVLVPHMKTAVFELCRGYKEILLASILLFVFLFIFANLGLQLYGGRLARCNDPSIKTRNKCVGLFSPDGTRPAFSTSRLWTNPRHFNFDNIGNAMLVLFEALSLKVWLNIRDVLVHDFGQVHAIYIHVFIFFGYTIGLTLFVGVIIANYSENKGVALLTVDQRRWCDCKKRLKLAEPLRLPPRPDRKLRLRAFIYDITQHVYFTRFFVLMVIVNSCTLCVKWRESDARTSMLTTISSCLSFVFVSEVSMKMIAFSPAGYWQSRRNRYDLLVTVLDVFWVITNYAIVNDSSNSFGFVVHILRFFSLTGKYDALKMLMLTVVRSVYKSFFIIMGMFLLIFVYALAGCLLFGQESIGRQTNFSSTPNSIVLLFRIIAGDDWRNIMQDENRENTSAIFYFCSFYVIIAHIVLNVLVAIIMENFSLFYSNEEEALLSCADIRNFQNTWNVIDANQQGVIPVRNVKFLLRLLEGRLQVHPRKDRLLLKHMCFELEWLHNGEDVSFHDVLNMLSYRSIDIGKSLQLDELLAREKLEFFIEEEVAKQFIRQWLSSYLKRLRTNIDNTEDNYRKAPDSGACAAAKSERDLVKETGGNSLIKRWSKENVDVFSSMKNLSSLESVVLASGQGHPFPSLAPRSELPMRLASTVSVIHELWRNEVAARDDSE